MPRPRCMQLDSNASRNPRGGCGTRAPRGAGCRGARTVRATDTKREHVRSAMQAIARSCGPRCAVDVGVEYARSGKCSQRRARRASADAAGNCWRGAGYALRESMHSPARRDGCNYAGTSYLLSKGRMFVHVPAWFTSLQKILAAEPARTGNRPAQPCGPCPVSHQVNEVSCDPPSCLSSLPGFRNDSMPYGPTDMRD